MTKTLLCSLALLLAACANSPRRATPRSQEMEPAVTPDRGPDRIEVDHILIGVRNPRMPDVNRDAAAAQVLADQIVAKLRDGGDFAALKQEHSDDRQRGVAGGPYAMTNHGVSPAHGKEYPRGGMVPAFGDVGFALEAGAIGVAPFDQTTSPFGIHIIKRTR